MRLVPAFPARRARTTADAVASRLGITRGEAKATSATAAALKLLPETARNSPTEN